MKTENVTNKANVYAPLERRRRDQPSDQSSLPEPRNFTDPIRTVTLAAAIEEEGRQ